MHNNINHNRIYYKKFAGYWDTYNRMREAGGGRFDSLFGAMMYNEKGDSRNNATKAFEEFITNTAPQRRRNETAGEARLRTLDNNAARWEQRAQNWSKNKWVPNWLARGTASVGNYFQDMMTDAATLTTDQKEGAGWTDKAGAFTSTAFNLIPGGTYAGVKTVAKIGTKEAAKQIAKEGLKNQAKKPGFWASLGQKYDKAVGHVTKYVPSPIRKQFTSSVSPTAADAMTYDMILTPTGRLLTDPRDNLSRYHESIQEMANRYKNKRVNHVRTPDRDYSRIRNAE